MGLYRSRQILRRGKDGFWTIIGWSIILFSFISLNCLVYEYVEGGKNYSDYSPNQLIVLLLLAGAYGGFLIIKKAFRLEKQFENAAKYYQQANSR